MTGKIEIQVCSDIDYENLIAEIYINDNFIALISEEDDPDDFHIEFPGMEKADNQKILRIRMDVFETTLKMAVEKLKALDDNESVG